MPLRNVQQSYEPRDIFTVDLTVLQITSLRDWAYSLLDEHRDEINQLPRDILEERVQVLVDQIKANLTPFEDITLAQLKKMPKKKRVLLRMVFQSFSDSAVHIEYAMELWNCNSWTSGGRNVSFLMTVCTIV